MRCSLAVLSCGLVSLLLVGCANLSNEHAAVAPQTIEPAWVTQPPHALGKVYGVGSMERYGDSAAAVKRAAEMATADLLSQLKVTIESDYSSSTSYSHGTEQPSAMHTQVSQSVRSRTASAELDEVKTVDTWLDERYAYALVELDRQQAGARLRRDLAELELQLQHYVQLQPTGNRLQQLQALLPALEGLVEHQRLAERLALVSIERYQPSLPSELRSLQQRINQQLDSLTVVLELRNSGARALQAHLIEGLTQQGLRLQSTGPADLHFIVDVELSDQQQKQNYYSFAHSQIIIEDGAGRALSAFSKQARGVSGMPRVARQHAAQQLAELIAQELAVTLVEKIR